MRSFDFLTNRAVKTRPTNNNLLAHDTTLTKYKNERKSIILKFYTKSAPFVKKITKKFSHDLKLRLSVIFKN